MARQVTARHALVFAGVIVMVGILLGSLLPGPAPDDDPSPVSQDQRVVIAYPLRGPSNASRVANDFFGNTVTVVFEPIAPNITQVDLGYVLTRQGPCTSGQAVTVDLRAPDGQRRTERIEHADNLIVGASNTLAGHPIRAWNVSQAPEPRPFPTGDPETARSMSAENETNTSLVGAWEAIFFFDPEIPPSGADLEVELAMMRYSGRPG